MTVNQDCLYSLIHLHHLCPLEDPALEIGTHYLLVHNSHSLFLLFGLKLIAAPCRVFLYMAASFYLFHNVKNGGMKEK